MKKQTKRSAFTLIELSIVLVIIGLILGGILVGQELISAAQIRDSISQIEKYKTAAYTFRSKYNAIPGDINSSSASGFGLIYRSGDDGHGDGDGMIEGCSGAATTAGCENILFWSDLSFARLISDPFTSATDGLSYMASNADFTSFAANFSMVSDAQAMAGPSPVSKDLLIPQSRLGAGNYVVVFTAQGKNYLQVTGVVSTDSSGNYTLSDLITPYQASSIDSKLDDRWPLTGSVLAMGGTGPLNVLAVPGTNSCVYNVGSPAPYNMHTSALSNGRLCQLRFNLD